MIRIYGVMLSDLPTTEELRALLSAADLAAWSAAHRGVTPSEKHLGSLAGLYLLRRCVEKGILTYDEKGRPFFKEKTTTFSITHTDRAAFLAVCDGTDERRVGIDAEDEARLSSINVQALAGRWFSAGELEELAQSSDPLTFLHIWTKKEALLKWRGEGIGMIRRADTSVAADPGLRFCTYRTGTSIVTLCCDQEQDTPDRILMLDRDAL